MIHGVVRGVGSLLADDRKPELSGPKFESRAGIIENAVFERISGKDGIDSIGSLILSAERHVICLFSGTPDKGLLAALSEHAKKGGRIMVFFAGGVHGNISGLMDSGAILKTGFLPFSGNFIVVDGKSLVLPEGNSALVIRNAKSLAQAYALDWRKAWDSGKIIKKGG